jgi:hypothetical protein
MTEESRRQSVRDYHARRALSGDRKVTVWLSEGARERLSALAKEYSMSKDKVAEFAICALREIGGE